MTTNKQLLPKALLLKITFVLIISLVIMGIPATVYIQLSSKSPCGKGLVTTLVLLGTSGNIKRPSVAGLPICPFSLIRILTTKWIASFSFSIVCKVLPSHSPKRTGPASNAGSQNPSFLFVAYLKYLGHSWRATNPGTLWSLLSKSLLPKGCPQRLEVWITAVKEMAE